MHRWDVTNREIKPYKAFTTGLTSQSLLKAAKAARFTSGRANALSSSAYLLTRRNLFKVKTSYAELGLEK